MKETAGFSKNTTGKKAASIRALSLKSLSVKKTWTQAISSRSASNFRLPNQTSGFGTAYWPLVISVSICGQFLGDQLQKLVLLQFTIHLLNIDWPRKVVIYLTLFKMSNTQLWPLVVFFLSKSLEGPYGTQDVCHEKMNKKGTHVHTPVFLLFLYFWPYITSNLICVQ